MVGSIDGRSRAGCWPAHVFGDRMDTALPVLFTVVDCPIEFQHPAS